MLVCFVIQPFDFGKFDKRYADVYQPAIKAAGLEAYRVDRDPGVEVPIEAIEELGPRLYAWPTSPQTIRTSGMNSGLLLLWGVPS